MNNGNKYGYYIGMIFAGEPRKPKTMDKKALQDYLNRHKEKTMHEIAQSLNIDIKTLYSRIREFGIETGRKPGPKKKEIVIPKD